MRIQKWITLFCLILHALLCSCVDVREEFWLHKDGSAEAEITCDLPRAATLAMGGPKGVKAIADELLADEEAIDSYETRIIETGKRVILKVNCSVDDLMDFDRVRSSIQSRDDLHPAVRKMVGEFNISIDGLTGISFKRRVAPAEAVPALRWLPKSQIEGHGFVKIMHFPSPVTDHNAHESWDDGRTLMWESSLASAIQTPMVYEFIMPLAIPWAWIIAGGLALVALIALGWRLLRRRAGAVGKKA